MPIRLSDDFFLKIRQRTLGSGSYNVASVTLDPVDINGAFVHWVIKKPLKIDEPVELAPNNPERALRKWAEINPGYPAYLFQNGWVMPYFKHMQATDEQIAAKILDIYRNTRHLILDAYAPFNFLSYRNGRGETQVICIDVDMACRPYVETETGERVSPVSDDLFEYWIQDGHISSYWLTSDPAIARPKTIAMLTILSDIESRIPAHLIKNEFLEADILTEIDTIRLGEVDLPLEAVIQGCLLKREINLSVFPLPEFEALPSVPHSPAVSPFMNSVSEDELLVVSSSTDPGDDQFPERPSTASLSSLSFFSLGESAVNSRITSVPTCN